MPAFFRMLSKLCRCPIQCPVEFCNNRYPQALELFRDFCKACERDLRRKILCRPSFDALGIQRKCVVREVNEKFVVRPNFQVLVYFAQYIFDRTKTDALPESLALMTSSDSPRQKLSMPLCVNSANASEILSRVSPISFEASDIWFWIFSSSST